MPHISYGKILIVLGLLLLLLTTVFLIFRSQITANLSGYSVSQVTENNSFFTLNQEQGFFYKAKGEGQDAANDFIKNGASIKSKKYLPDGFEKNTKIIRVARDQDMKKDISSYESNKEHYFYDQKINGIPVYGASVIVHIQNKNEVYSASGNIVTNDSVPKASITFAEAEAIAKSKALLDSKSPRDLKVQNLGEYIINLKLLGVSDDSQNHLTYAVKFDSITSIFSKRYFVDLTVGKIIYEENLINELMQRKVYDCQKTSNPPNCQINGTEGAPPIGSDKDTIGMYQLMKDVYDYYFNTFGRDGLDGRGSPLESYVNIRSYIVQGKTISCTQQANAVSMGGGVMGYCTGLATRDIAAHEFTHGVVGSTARLAQGYQYSALNESIADSFANAIDGNWIMGEGSILGVIRDMSNPPSQVDLGLGQHPDKLFHSAYDCAGEEEHHNAGVANKAFYLMTQGGSFNGCTVTGIGTVRSHAILYKALTQYMTPTTNFYVMYTSMNQACNDLYDATSDTCKEVKKAYEATEMDQQTPTSARGAKCTGKGEKPATCSNAPTSPPIPGIPTATSAPPTATPTPIPGQPTATPVPGAPTSTPTPTTTPAVTTPTAVPTPVIIFQMNGTPTPTPDQYFTCIPDPNCAKNGKTIQLCPLICTPE